MTVSTEPDSIDSGAVAPGAPRIEPGARPSRRRRRLLIVAGIITVVVLVRRTGLTDLLGDEQRLQELVDSAGLFGPLLFVALFTVLVPVGVPGLVFVLPAAVVFPEPLAVAVCLAGGYTSSAIGMWFARKAGRDTIAAKLPPRFARWDAAIGRRGLPAVLGLRIVTYLAAPADWLLGLSSIPTRQLVVGTAVGLVPPTLLYVYVGGGVLDLVL